MRPICAKCRREMYPAKNEVPVRDEVKGDFPSTFHYGDLYECEGCGAQIITGFGNAIPLERMPKGDVAEAVVFRR